MPVVPDILMTRLRQTTEQFRQARQRMDEADLQDEKQQDRIRAVLLAAEHELDDVTRQIRELLSSNADQSPGASPGEQRPGQ